MELNPAQKEAVEYLSGPLLVLAGPGTGKTQLLSEKVVYILEHTDTNPENILCLTFTESGASNMRERLRSLIHGDALKVNIYTYHSFGIEILAQYKQYSPDFTRRLDSAVDEVTRFKIIKAIQESLPARDILRGDSVLDIASIISDAKAAQLTADDLAQIAEQNIADAKVLSESISPLLQNVVPRQFQASYDAAYEPIHQLLSKYSETTPIQGNIERSIAGLARDLNVAITEACAEEKIKPLSAWKDKYFEKDPHGNFRLKERIANKKLQSLAKIMKKYNQYLHDNGLFDFDDMINESVKALNTDQGFKLTLSERYQFIMLDEFQDTNPSQFAIVKALTDYEKPIIMAVGDDDQAIYEFQGALSSNLTDYQKHYNAKVITLTENYRSTQEILDFSRQIINQADDRFADKELVAHRPDPKESQIYRYEFAGADAEYAFVADKIAELIDQGVKQDEIAVISHKTKYFEPLLPYLKAHPRIKIAYEKRDNLLEDQKIHEIVTILRFVHDLANEQKPSVSLLEILTYPFFDLPTLEVLKLAEQARSEHQSLFSLLAEADADKYPSAEKFHTIADFLSDLIGKSFTESAESIINQLIAYMEASPATTSEKPTKIVDKSTKNQAKIEPKNTNTDPEDTLVSYETYNFYENLASLEGKLRSYAGDKTLHVADLLAMIDDYETAGMQLSATSPYRDADEAVQILTAHKAKGLEFSYVFIISADHSAWGKGKGNNTLFSLPKNLTQIHHTGITDSEHLRVLYVALTRSKHTLYITNSLKDFNDKKPERLEYFNEYIEKTDEGEVVVSPHLPSKYVRTEYDLAPPDVHEQNLRNWLSVYHPTSPEMKSLYKDRLKNWRMSASALTSFIDIIYAGPEEFFKNYILRVPHGPDTEALALGDLIHKTFEAVTNRKLTLKQASDFYLKTLDEQGLPPQITKDLREKGTASIEQSLGQFSEILQNGRAEVDFYSDHPSINGIPLAGKIDHLNIDEEHKIIEIYDFKTGMFHKQNWRTHPTLYKYMLQLEFYKLLLKLSPKYSKYKVDKAHILFVMPDKDNQVYDKVYEFNPEDEQEFLALLEAVYYQVSTLKFISDPELMIAPSTSRSLKEIRAFIELLLAKHPSN